MKSAHVKTRDNFQRVEVAGQKESKHPDLLTYRNRVVAVVVLASTRQPRCEPSNGRTHTTQGRSTHTIRKCGLTGDNNKGA